MPTKRKVKSYALDRAVSQLPLVIAAKNRKPKVDTGLKHEHIENDTIVIESEIMKIILPCKN